MNNQLGRSRFTSILVFHGLGAYKDQILAEKSLLVSTMPDPRSPARSAREPGSNGRRYGTVTPKSSATTYYSVAWAEAYQQLEQRLWGADPQKWQWAIYKRHCSPTLFRTYFQRRLIRNLMLFAAWWQCQ